MATLTDTLAIASDLNISESKLSGAKADSDGNFAGGCARLGRSPFWLQVDPESCGVLSSPAYRVSVNYKPARKRNPGIGSPIFDISPRHPIMTIKASGESFPLIATECQVSDRGYDVELRGTRKMYLSELHVVDFSIKLKPVAGKTGTQMAGQFSCHINPPLPKKSPADLKIELYFPMHHPEVWGFPYAPDIHDGSFMLWNPNETISVSCVLPGVEPRKASDPKSDAFSSQDSGLLITHTVPDCIKANSGTYKFSMRFDHARVRSHAQFMHLSHAQKLLSPAIPIIGGPATVTLRQRALSAMTRIMDKNVYHSAGIERVYFKPLSTETSDEFCAGFPHFPLDAARAMLDWDRLIGDEQAARLAILIARGIGTDFAVISADSTGKCANKGAIWDRRLANSTPNESSFTDFLGDDFHSIASTARIAAGLFRVYQLTGDPISMNAGVNAAQWLLLRQNESGYYDGDRVDASTGAIVHEPGSLIGAEVIHALIHAYYATGNEVYIKAAHRVERQIMSELVPQFAATPIFRTNHHDGLDTPVSVAALIRAIALTHTLLHTRRSAEELEQAGIWLKSWDLSDLCSLGSADQDGRWGGLYEIARACLAMAGLFKDPTWLQMALSIGASLPKAAWEGWQAVPLFAETMLGLVSLVKNSSIDYANLQAKAGWGDFTPDSSTHKYINVVALAENGDGDIPVDFLPLVSRGDGRVLLPILAHGPVKQIQVIQNGRLPNLKDLVKNEIICQPIQLHKLPFPGPWRWGCFTIEP